MDDASSFARSVSVLASCCCLIITRNMSCDALSARLCGDVIGCCNCAAAAAAAAEQASPSAAAPPGSSGVPPARPMLSARASFRLSGTELVAFVLLPCGADAATGADSGVSAGGTVVSTDGGAAGVTVGGTVGVAALGTAEIASDGPAGGAVDASDAAAEGGRLCLCRCSTQPTNSSPSAPLLTSPSPIGSSSRGSTFKNDAR